MIEYFENRDLACVDGYKFRRDKKTGYFLSSKRINGKRKRLHVYIWEKENGTVPKGFHVHHVDEDKYNNELNNLMLIEGVEHVKKHSEEYTPERIESAKKNLIEKAVPKSKEWHRSKEGREWHKKNGVEAYAKREKKEYVCSYCGKPFETTKLYSEGQNTFCSNNCKSAYRRKSGVDNIEKTCARCGNKYIGNKYSYGKYCEDCRRVLGYPRGRIQHGG